MHRFCARASQSLNRVPWILFQPVSWTPWPPWAWLRTATVFATNLASSIRKSSTAGRSGMNNRHPSCLKSPAEWVSYYHHHHHHHHRQLMSFFHVWIRSGATRLMNAAPPFSINGCHYAGWGGRWLAALWQPLGEGPSRVHASRELLRQDWASPRRRQMGRHSGKMRILSAK